MGTLIAVIGAFAAIIGFFMYAKRQGKSEALAKQSHDSYLAERKREAIEAGARTDPTSVGRGVSDYFRSE
jgi:uncharacterized membrane protein YdjX (TVP38/TMEM64 family)